MAIVPNPTCKKGTTTTLCCIAEEAKEEESIGVVDRDDDNVFDMVSLRNHLPFKRKGLSIYYAGKSRSFRRIEDARSAEDLRKEEIVPEAKRRKYDERTASLRRPSQPHPQPSPCRTFHGPNSSGRGRCVGVHNI